MSAISLKFWCFSETAPMNQDSISLKLLGGKLAPKVVYFVLRKELLSLMKPPPGTRFLVDKVTVVIPYRYPMNQCYGFLLLLPNSEQEYGVYVCMAESLDQGATPLKPILQLSASIALL